jgi:hypothetical protein
MGTVAVKRVHVVAGDRYLGKFPVYRCKSCTATFVDPEVERDFMQTLALVARGHEPERENFFEIQRESAAGPKRSFWSNWFASSNAANDIERKSRERAR